MKRRIAILMVLIILLSTFVVSTTYTTPKLSATLLSQNPDPVEPGQIVKVKFKIENEGSQTNDDVIVKLLPKFPFTLYGDVDEKNIGKLRATSEGEDAAIVEFNLKVSENAVEEDIELELEIVGGDTSTRYTNNEFMIDIQTHDAVLDISSITYNPEEISPGNTAEVSIKVKNLADSLLKDVKFKLDFSDDDLPLAPYKSSSEKIIAQLGSKNQDTLKFNLIADPQCTPGLYKIPLTVNYNDEKGNSYSYEDILAILVGEKPTIRVYVKKSTILTDASEGTVTLEIANAGSSDLKFLELELLTSENYELISTTNYFYLGDVDSDDTESEDIQIYVKDDLDNLLIPVQLKYFDSNNKPYEQKYDLNLKLHSEEELKRFGLSDSNGSWIYIVIIIVGVAGYFIYKKYFKNKKK